jgi:hypothetical protein
MDGTFQYACQHFYQFFTLHGFKNGLYVPVVFALLPNKTVHTYSKLSEHINIECSKFGLTLNPIKIVVVFENGIHLAIQHSFPQAQIKGCFFHLKQAWYKKILKLGLSSKYKYPSSEEGQWLKKIFDLPFSPSNEIGDIFCFELMASKPDNDILTKFCDYLVTNYVEESSRFPPYLWSQVKSEQTRTTHVCESFHSHFNKSFYFAHANIYVFVDSLLTFQTSTYIKMTTAKKNVSKHVSV